ncbi:coiled-coil domain-containing protein 152 [Pelodytes ibericus]
MKESCMVILDKLLEDYSLIEKRISELNGKNNILELQLEKSKRLWNLSRTKEMNLQEERAALQKVVRGLQETIESQCNMRDENASLKKRISMLEDKLQVTAQDHNKQLDSLASMMKTKQQGYEAQMQKLASEMNAKFILKEEESNNLLSKKDKEIEQLKQQLKSQEKEKQSELIKQQIEFNTKLARIQCKPRNPYPSNSSLSQSIYRTKLQHLQEEKNKEIECLRNRIKDLESQISSAQVSHLKRRRF